MRLWYILCVAPVSVVVLGTGEKITVGLRVVPPSVERLLTAAINEILAAPSS